MPRGDGTGPMGLGSKTGRAMGYCAGYSVPGYMNPAGGFGGRGGFGRAFGRGGRGLLEGCRGWGFRNMFRATGLPGWARFNMGYPVWGGAIKPDNAYPNASGAFTPEQEAVVLKNQAKVLQDNLNALHERIQELERLEVKKDKPEK